MKVKDHFLRFLLPFAFAPAAQAPVELASWKKLLVAEPQEKPSATSSLWQPLAAAVWSQYSDFLLPFFREFLSPQAPSPACVMLSLNPGIQEKIFGPAWSEADPKEGRVPYELWFRGRLLPWQVNFTSAQLVLFNTGIGFLVLELDIVNQPVTTADLAQLSWHLRHIQEYHPVALDKPLIEDDYQRYQDRTAPLPFLRRGSEEADNFMEPKTLDPELPHPFLAHLHQPRLNSAANTYEFPFFTLPELMRFLLKAIPEPRWLIDKYLLGAHFVRTGPYTDNGKKNDDLYYLRRMYKDTYQGTAADLELENNPEITSTFANITFGQSLEGEVILVEDPGHPFFQQFIDRARYHYFMPYLLAWHQRFALINFAININKLDETDLTQVRQLRQSAFNFVLRWRFEQVSNTTMYNRVYHA